VLLVDDSEDDRRLIAMLLERAGYRVSLAEDGQLGLERALAARESGEPFDVILMDISMPVLDGCEATRRLRASGYELPIVALTALSTKEDKQRCLEAGCDDFETKPVRRRALLDSVRGHVSKRA
jgi:CheY-like chemotaxis protein